MVTRLAMFFFSPKRSRCFQPRVQRMCCASSSELCPEVTGHYSTMDVCGCTHMDHFLDLGWFPAYAAVWTTPPPLHPFLPHILLNCWTPDASLCYAWLAFSLLKTGGDGITEHCMVVRWRRGGTTFNTVSCFHPIFVVSEVSFIVVGQNVTCKM